MLGLLIFMFLLGKKQKATIILEGVKNKINITMRRIKSPNEYTQKIVIYRTKRVKRACVI